MRDCFKTHNYAPIPGLIEEVQVLANKMEAALYDQKDFVAAKREYERLKKKLKKLDAKIGAKTDGE
jgi:hypothetical protein